MTPEQRYFFDVAGYLHLENALSDEELRRAQEAAEPQAEVPAAPVEAPAPVRRRQREQREAEERDRVENEKLDLERRRKEVRRANLRFKIRFSTKNFLLSSDLIIVISS